MTLIQKRNKGPQTIQFQIIFYPKGSSVGIGDLKQVRRPDGDC